MRLRILTVVVVSAFVGGCASVSRGTSEMVEINALPADASIRTSLGESCKVGPCKVKVSRKTEFTAFAEKPGYLPGSLLIKTKVGGGGAAGLAGNILIGGVVGVGIDAATGASLDHYPNPALIVLAPIDPKNPATPVIEPPPPVEPTPVAKDATVAAASR